MRDLVMRLDTEKMSEQKRAAIRTALILGVIVLIIYLSVFIRGWS